MLNWDENPFWYDVSARETRNQHHQSDITWFSSKIRTENKPLLWTHAFLNDLLYAGQLFKNAKVLPVKKIIQNFGLMLMHFSSLIEFFHNCSSLDLICFVMIWHFTRFPCSFIFLSYFKLIKYHIS